MREVPHCSEQPGASAHFAPTGRSRAVLDHLVGLGALKAAVPAPGPTPDGRILGWLVIAVVVVRDHVGLVLMMMHFAVKSRKGQRFEAAPAA